MTDEVLDSLRRQFEDMALVIIDEMSLVGADFLYHLHKRFVEVCRNQDHFGNKAMLLVGDLLQIPPTKQRSIFAEPKILQNQALYKSSENLWDSFQTVTLLVNKRQGVSKWRDTLSRVRIGGMNTDDEKLIESRRVSNDEHKDKDFDDALHLFFDNDSVCRHNEEMIAKLQGEEAKNLKADIRGYPRGCQPKIKYESFVEETRMQKILTLKKGAKVIHNFNIDLIDGLVNGVTGKVIGFSYRTPSKFKGHLPGANISTCIVKFDDPNVGQNFRKDHQDVHKLVKEESGVPIFRKNLSMRIDRLPSSAECSVEQFPLNLFYASTSHKIQGKTFQDQDVVCYTHKWIKAGCGYVMLSRCTKIENVYISKDFDIKKVTPHLPSLKMTNQLVRDCLASKLKQEKFDIFYTNMRGKANLTNVQHDPYAIQSNLVCLVETNILDQTDVEWQGKMCLSHESTGQGNGVCAFANETQDHPYQFIGKRCGDRFQILQLKKEDKFQIFILYISQDAILSSVADELEDMRLNDLESIVLGDFNYDANASEKNPLANYLSKTLLLKQIVSGPTYIFGPNTIDQIHVPKDLADEITEISRFNYYSDHLSFNICLP